MTTNYRPRHDQPAKEMLRDRGVNLRELGRATGVPQSQLVTALNGRITPSRRIYDAVCVGLGEEREPQELFRLDLLMATKWFRGLVAERLDADAAARGDCDA